MCICMYVYTYIYMWNALGTSCTVSWVDMGGGGITHGDVQVQAFSVWYGTVHSTSTRCAIGRSDRCVPRTPLRAEGSINRALRHNSTQ